MLQSEESAAAISLGRFNHLAASWACTFEAGGGGREGGNWSRPMPANGSNHGCRYESRSPGIANRLFQAELEIQLLRQEADAGWSAVAAISLMANF